GTLNRHASPVVVGYRQASAARCYPDITRSDDSLRSRASMRAAVWIRRFSVALMAASVPLFVYSFLRTSTGSFSGSCSGTDCLSHDAFWALTLPIEIIVFVA